MATEISSGSIYFSGLGSDNDWDTMITQLKQIESKYANRLVSWRNDWQLRLDAFATLRTSMSTLSAKMKTMSTEASFLSKTSTVADPKVATATATGDAIDGTYNLEVNQLAQNSYASIDTGVTDKLASLSNTASDFDFTYGVPGGTNVSVSLSVPPNTSLEGLKTLINQSTQNTGVKATLLQAGGTYTLQLYSNIQGAGTDISVSNNNFFQATGNAWSTSQGKNAEVKINGWPSSGYHSVAGNTLSMYDGLTINLMSTGSTSITVATDTEKITANVKEFVDDVNSVLNTIQKLTKIDDSKATTDSDYATSQFDSQKGSVLTGNYGVQTMASKFKNAIFSQALGFQYYDSDNNTGDLISTLSQIGLKTDTDTASSTYGMIVFETDPSKMTFEKALAQDATGVAELFAAKKKGSTTYQFASIADTSMSALQPGTYHVDYTYDPTATSPDKAITGTINGKELKYYPDTNQIGLVASDGSAPNDADGILINLLDVTSSANFEVSIKQGKMTELCTLIDYDFLEADTDDWTQNGSQVDDHKGTLSILESQYKRIIQNINEKIAKEETRLVTWEKRMRLKFSRLEATLSTYNQTNSMLEYQMKSLSGNSSK